MAQDRTQDRTQTAGAQMDDGRSKGQLTSPNARALNHVDQQRENARQAMLADVEHNKGEIMKLLAPFDISYEFFEAGLRIFLMKQMQDQPDFFTTVTSVSFLEALFRIAQNGLVADGKEAAIAVYKGKATALFMRDGFIKVLWRTGMIKDINDNVVTEAEEAESRFEYMEGSDGYVRHRPSMKRTNDDVTLAAYCVVTLVTGGQIREVVTQDELKKIAAMSRSPARKEWKFQMDRKAAIRRAMGKMPREKAIVQLLAHDDLNYDLKPAPQTIERTVVMQPSALFSDKAAVKTKPQEIAHEPAEVVDTETVGPPPAVEPAADVVTAIRHAETIQALGEIKAKVGETAEGYDDEELDWIDGAIDARAAELTSGSEGGVQQEYVVDEDQGKLLAVISSDKGPRAYENAQEWRDDLLNKLSSLTGPQAKAFAKLNAQYVRNALEAHPDEAGRVMKVFQDRNLIAKEGD